MSPHPSSDVPCLVGVDHHTASRTELDALRAVLPAVPAGVLVLDGPDHLAVVASAADLAPFARALVDAGATPWSRTGTDVATHLVRAAAGLDARWPGDGRSLRALRRARLEPAGDALPGWLARLALATVVGAERARAAGSLDEVWNVTVHDAVERALDALDPRPTVLVAGADEATTVAVAQLRAAGVQPSVVAGSWARTVRLVATPSCRVEPADLARRSPPSLLVWGTPGAVERAALVDAWPAWRETTLLDLSPCADGARALGEDVAAVVVPPGRAVGVLRAEAVAAATAAASTATWADATDVARRAAQRARVEHICIDELTVDTPGVVLPAAQVLAMARSIAGRLVPTAGARAAAEA